MTKEKFETWCECSHQHNSNYIPYLGDSYYLPISCSNGISTSTDSTSDYYYNTEDGKIYHEPCDVDRYGYLITTIQINKPKYKPMNKLTNALKKILPSDIQKQYCAGFRDGELSLSEFGKNELLEILADKYKEELTERADEIIKEENEK